MSFRDLLRLSLRNLREAKLRAFLTTMGVIVGVAVIVTMISFGLGLQRNTIARFKDLDLFNEITVFGKRLSDLVESGLDQQRGTADSGEQAERNRQRTDKPAERPLDDAGLAEISKLPGVASVEPNVAFTTYIRINGKARTAYIGGAL